MSLEQEFLEEFGTCTFSDETPAQRGLGWSPAEDERDLRAENYLTAERTSGKAFWANPIQLDQGTEGACVGFGWTGFLNAKPLKHEYDNEMGFDVYHRAQEIDEWPGRTTRALLSGQGRRYSRSGDTSTPTPSPRTHRRWPTSS